MGRNQTSSHDDSRRESFPRRGHRGRGRSRGRYSKDGDHITRSQRNYRNSYNETQGYKKSRNSENNNFPTEQSTREENIDSTRMEDRINSNDLYNQQNSDTAIREGRPLEERISVPTEKQMDFYMDDNIPEHPKTNIPLNSQPSRENGPNLSGKPNKDELLNDNITRDSELNKDKLPTSMLLSSKEENILKECPGASSKDPEELRQKVLESLAEKKKKAAVFMNMEKDGAIKADILSENQITAIPGDSGESGNPERDAAVDALLATFGGPPEAKSDELESFSNENIDEAFRNRTDLDVQSRAHGLISPGSSNGQNLKQDQDKFDDRFTRGSSHEEKYARSRESQEFTIKGEHERYRDAPVPSRAYYEPATKRDPGLEYRPSLEYGKERKPIIRQDPRYRFGRYEGPEYPSKDSKYRGKAMNNRNDFRYHHPDDEHRTPGNSEYYRSAELAKDSHPKDGYESAKAGRYLDRGLQDVKYDSTSREFSSYTPPGRYIVPLGDPRYPPSASARGPDTEYATALYYRDLTEWLEVTGYHDYSYRQMVLQRRDMHALEENRRYAPPDDSGYISRSQQLLHRDDPDPRRARGSSAYSMPPPPLPNTLHWEERDSSKRSIPGSVPARPHSRNSAYPMSGSKEEADYRGEFSHPPAIDKTSLKRRISLRDGDFNDPPRSAKSIRQEYEPLYRGSPSNLDDRRRADNSHLSRDEIDETEAVRQSLSKRIAASRSVEASPLSSERIRQRSPSASRIDNSQRDLSIAVKNHRDSEVSPHYQRDYLSRSRVFSARGSSKEGFRNSLRGRRGSFGDQPPSPVDRRHYSRGRGRGYSKDFSYERNQRYESRGSAGDVMDLERNPSFIGEARNSNTRYFMIKSFNDDNVKMAQQDNIWATQQKNAEALEQAYNESRDVILFFSINKSGKFQGYARMEGSPGSAPIPSWAKNLLWESSGPFRIRWISITDISFHRVAHLKNRLNEGQPVLIGRDGQEIDSDCGFALCKTIDETAAFRKIHGPSED